MRVRALIVLTIAALFVTRAVAQPAQPCGITSLVIARTVQFRRAYAAIHPASIVIYSPPPHGGWKAISNPTLRKELTRAGHRVSVVEDTGVLVRFLQTDVIDLVLTVAADQAVISSLAAASLTQPVVLSVVSELVTEQLEASQAGCQRRSADARGADHYLSTIDEVMEARAEQKKKKGS